MSTLTEIFLENPGQLRVTIRYEIAFLLLPSRLFCQCMNHLAQRCQGLVDVGSFLRVHGKGGAMGGVINPSFEKQTHTQMSALVVQANINAIGQTDHMHLGKGVCQGAWLAHSLFYTCSLQTKSLHYHDLKQ